MYDDRWIVLRWDAESEPAGSSSQPGIMAIMLERLDLKPGQRVLEMCAYSGFNVALIAAAVGPSGTVVTMDFWLVLVEYARGHLDETGCGHPDNVLRPP